MTCNVPAADQASTDTCNTHSGSDYEGTDDVARHIQSRVTCQLVWLVHCHIHNGNNWKLVVFMPCCVWLTMFDVQDPGLAVCAQPWSGVQLQ